MKKKKEKNNSFNLRSFFHYFSDSTSKLNKRDWIIMGVLVVLYLIISFYHLGTLQSPKTYYQFTYENEEVGIELAGVSQDISKICYYTGPEIGEFSVMVSTDGEEYQTLTFHNTDGEEVTTFHTTSAFAWEDLNIDSSFKYIKFIAKTPGSYLGEVQLYNKYGEKLLAKANDDQSALIIDEADTVPSQISYLNSSYFDEIYFARSAYEYVHGIDTMEWVHPPLGKLIMAIPILLLGMSTFSYRLMGTIAGVLMIPTIYILAKRIFKNRKWATLAGILMTFDCFHFAQTRMGTVDSFLVLFILLSALFMYQYISQDNRNKKSSRIINLFLSGFFAGCSIATKWTGLFAGVALAIVFFADLFYKKYKQMTDYRPKIQLDKIILTIMGFGLMIPVGIYYLTVMFTSDLSLAALLTVIYYGLLMIFGILYYIVKIDRESWKLFTYCFLFFVCVPIVIYLLSYMLFPNVAFYTDNSIAGIFNQIKEMYAYHSGLQATHDFTSNWYTWPFMIKPVWYYVGYYGGNIKGTIVGIGNPAIWWFGILAFIYLVIASIIKKKKELLFILVFILCNWLPYLLIGRVMFMYHFFPTLPFVMLAIVAFVKWITEKFKNNSFYIFYVSVVILFFILFYPVISGMITSSDYIDSLKWLSTWIF